MFIKEARLIEKIRDAGEMSTAEAGSRINTALRIAARNELILGMKSEESPADLSQPLMEQYYERLCAEMLRI